MILFCNDEHHHKLATKEDVHRLETILRQIESQILMKVSEIPAFVSSVKDELLKAKTEILDKIAALEATTTDADLSPETVAALTDLKAAAQGLDDIVVDVTDLPPPTGTPLSS